MYRVGGCRFRLLRLLLARALGADRPAGGGRRWLRRGLQRRSRPRASGATICPRPAPRSKGDISMPTPLSGATSVGLPPSAVFVSYVRDPAAGWRHVRQLPVRRRLEPHRAERRPGSSDPRERLVYQPRLLSGPRIPRSDHRRMGGWARRAGSGRDRSSSSPDGFNCRIANRTGCLRSARPSSPAARATHRHRPPSS